jgi:hypothetical protein
VRVSLALMMKQRFAFGLSMFVFGLLLIGSDTASTRVDASGEVSQVVSPTPDRVVIPTVTAVPTDGTVPTDVPPTFTPIAEGPPQLQARETAGNVNIRLEADPEAQIVGTIQYGDSYVVTGRYFRWLQIRFEPSPSRHGFVFEELVEIIGDESRIPDLTQDPQPDSDEGGEPSAVDATAEWQEIQQTPGIEMTLTADTRILELPVLPGTGGDDDLVQPENEDNGPANAEQGSGPGVLPTFTYPPNLVAQAPTSEALEDGISATPDAGNALNIDVGDGVAPIVPIAVLAGLGMLGLVIVGLRR